MRGVSNECNISTERERERERVGFVGSYKVIV